MLAHQIHLNICPSTLWQHTYLAYQAIECTRDKEAGWLISFHPHWNRSGVLLLIELADTSHPSEYDGDSIKTSIYVGNLQLSKTASMERLPICNLEYGLWRVAQPTTHHARLMSPSSNQEFAMRGQHLAGRFDDLETRRFDISPI